MMKIQGYVSLELGQMRTSFLKIKKFLSWTTTNQNFKNRGGKPIIHQHMLKNKIKFFTKNSPPIFLSPEFVHILGMITSRLILISPFHEELVNCSEFLREFFFKTCSYRNFWNCCDILKFPSDTDKSKVQNV